MAIESKDLLTLTNDLYHINDGSVSEVEAKIFKHLITSIDKQIHMLEETELPPSMKKTLMDFKITLTSLIAIANKL